MRSWISRNSKKLLKAKVAASELETLREFGVWYNGRWKKDYPDLYANRWNTPRRLMEISTPPRVKRVTVVTPSSSTRRPVKRTRVVTIMPVRRRSRSVRRMRRRVRGRVSKRKSFKRTALRRTANPLRITPKAKRCTVYVQSTADLQPCNNLIPIRLTGITQGDGINERERQSITVSGFRLRFFFKNALNRSGEGGASDPAVGSEVPIKINMALIWQDQRTDNYAGAAVFFRTGANNQYAAFGDGTLNGLDRATLPMNVDQDAVLWHTRFGLGVHTTGQDYSAGSINNYRSLSRYIKIKRRVEYFGAAPTQSEGNFFLLIWAEGMDFGASGSEVANGFRYVARIEMFFRDPGA